MTAFLRCLLLVFVTLPCALSAHRLDEYLQSTLVDIEPGEIHLDINLTPGVAVAEKVLAKIDRYHGGTISEKECSLYAQSLKRDLVFRLDGRELKLNLAASTFPTPAEMRAGTGIILLDFSINAGPLSPGTHKLTLENHHLPAISVYLINAAHPHSATIQITSQTRNTNQSVGEISFDFRHALGN